MSLSIPKEQRHNSDVPVMIPFYQYVRLSPIQSSTDVTINTSTFSDEVRFEITGDNVINLSKTYLQYQVKVKFAKIAANVNSDKWPEHYPSHIALSPEGFGLASVRICNQTGTDLVRVDDTYEPYRVFMDELNRRWEDQYNQNIYYDGIKTEYDNDWHNFKIQDYYYAELPKSSTVIKNNGDYKTFDRDVVMEDTQPTVTAIIKLPLGKLFNTIGSLDSDIFFGERIYLSFRWQQLSKFTNVKDDFIGTKVSNPDIRYQYNYGLTPIKSVRLTDLKLYACYNKDPECNKNTMNYCLSKPIEFNDFRCHQITQANPNGTFSYSFTLNSSNGPYLRFIIYRCYDKETGKPIKFQQATTKSRWLVNDFVWTPDYDDMKYADEYELIKPYVKNTWFDMFRSEPFCEKYFNILNFGSYDLANIKSRAGRPLASDLKVTLELTTGSDDFKKSCKHCFYIITGRLLTINQAGIVNVI